MQKTKTLPIILAFLMALAPLQMSAVEPQEMSRNPEYILAIGCAVILSGLTGWLIGIGMQKAQESTSKKVQCGDIELETLETQRITEETNNSVGFSLWPNSFHDTWMSGLPSQLRYEQACSLCSPPEKIKSISSPCGRHLAYDCFTNECSYEESSIDSLGKPYSPDSSEYKPYAPNFYKGYGPYSN